MYQQRNGLKPVACGKFIDDKKVVAQRHQRQHILFVNPKIEKGALIVVQLALTLQELRPDITIEVVESRGKWADAVERLREAYGDKLDKLTNVKVTATTQDMRPVYGRAKLVLQPSLWWESGSRVLAEAMLNGIPAIVSDSAGGPEMVGNGGIKVKLPDVCYEKPYNQLPGQSVIKSIADRIIQLYDDDNLYQQLCNNAKKVGEQVHSIERSTDRLLDAFQPLLARQAGDNEFNEMMTSIHKQLDSTD
jgi:glycosyltransferase involved in cell wall biosynthesis